MRVRRVKPYVCVDVDFADHFRFQAAKDLELAAGTWLRCLAYSRAKEQDGLVRATWLKRAFGGAFDRVEDLVRVGLLRPREDGDYELHAYAPRNQTRAMLEEGSDHQDVMGIRGVQGGPSRRALPTSERGLSGPFWVQAFTDGVTDHTKRPCTAGPFYRATLERLVTHHAPRRDAASACAWLRSEAHAFAARWEGNHPPKGLTPDGLERWLNDGRPGPPEFGKARIVQPSAEEWHEDDWSDLGAEVVQ